jgi:hypothetical protein
MKAFRPLLAAKARFSLGCRRIGRKFLPAVGAVYLRAWALLTARLGGPGVRVSRSPGSRLTIRIVGHGVAPGLRGHVIGPEGDKLLLAELVRRDIAAQGPA